MISFTRKHLSKVIFFNVFFLVLSAKLEISERKKEQEEICSIFRNAFKSKEVLYNKAKKYINFVKRMIALNDM